MIDDVLFDVEERMEKTVEALRSDLLAVRTGRASPALLDRVRVEAYGSVMPLNQVATVSVPEARLLVIRPFDVSTVGAIERAILKSDLGLTPNNDGKIIRLSIPPLTNERRRDLARMVGRRVEEARVAIRNLRRDGMKELADLEKNKEISEDEHFKAREDLQKLTDDYIAKVDKVGEAKEAEIMEV
ncbi:MAG: ribosome recycling factor [Chloroflexi bacterium]|nr:ribosome recycling factor [Chloroflexota bacterium]